MHILALHYELKVKWAWAPEDKFILLYSESCSNHIIIYEKSVLVKCSSLFAKQHCHFVSHRNVIMHLKSEFDIQNGVPRTCRNFILDSDGAGNTHERCWGQMICRINLSKCVYSVCVQKDEMRVLDRHRWIKHRNNTQRTQHLCTYSRCGQESCQSVEKQSNWCYLFEKVTQLFSCKLKSMCYLVTWKSNLIM